MNREKLNCILTIAVPTYNRAALLDRCLKSIFSQRGSSDIDVEVIISDNASTDNTVETVEHYVNRDNVISYKNDSNLGFDGNFIQCFTKAKGKYVWILGDDDFILPGALEQILFLLRSGDFGVLHLNTLPFHSEEEVNLKDVSELLYDSYSDSIEYFKLISYFTTFVSGNIFNKSVVGETINIDVKNTNIVQLFWVLPALFAGEKNIMVKTKTIATQADNSGGYKFIQTFSVNYNKILNSLIKRGYNKQIISISNKKMIKEFFPYYICKILYEDSGFNKENGFNDLLNTYWNYPDFWKIILPLYGNYYFKKVIGKT